MYVARMTSGNILVEDYTLEFILEDNNRHVSLFLQDRWSRIQASLASRYGQHIEMLREHHLCLLCDRSRRLKERSRSKRERSCLCKIF